MPLPNRQSIRRKGWDYATPGWYFVTCNTHGGHSIFGTIVKGRMVLNAVGQMVEKAWHSIEEFHPEYRLDEFVVMPNHVHGLMGIARAGATARAGGPPPSLPEFMRRFKSIAVAEYVRGEKAGVLRPPPSGKLWHRNYWDVIVRDEMALANIRRYIRENPANYDAVWQCGSPKMLGNAALLDLPKVGFLASRGRRGRPSRLPSLGEAIISGFLSPMERAVFEEGLRKKIPLVWVKPWGLGESATAYPCGIHAALNEGRLLILSPFDEKIIAPSARRAVWCNEYVLQHCERLVVGHLNPAGMLACLLSEIPPDLPIEYPP